MHNNTISIGTDIVQTDRLKSWETFSYDQLRRIFSEQELIDCDYKNFASAVPKLAARFAAKEAFFKAISAALVNLGMIENTFSLLFLCKHVEVSKKIWNIPVLNVNWKAIEAITGKLQEMRVELSLSHEKEYAIAFVVILTK